MLCLDTSVLCKLLRYEQGSDEINEILDRSSDNLGIHASELVIYEMGNFLWKMHRKGIGLPDESLDFLYDLDIEFVPLTTSIADRALTVSRTRDLTYYAAIHISLTREKKAPLVTADKQILSKCDDAITLEECLNLIETRS